MHGHDIIVIGASAGGVEALQHLVANLPQNLPAVVCVVIHLPAISESMLPHILERAGNLPALHPHDRMAMQYGHIYIAPPDRHLLIERQSLRLVNGPREHGFRPAIDTLFRSAARAYGPRVVGVILTGMLDDGSAGLIEIKACGGVAVVQDPQTAMFDSMPRSAIRHAKVDHILPLEEIPQLLVRLANEPAPGVPPPQHDQAGAMVKLQHSELDTDQQLGTTTNFRCPECGGVLHEHALGSMLRFRCTLGHAFSLNSLLASQTKTLEQALYTALYALEEKAALLHRRVQRSTEQGYQRAAKKFAAEVQQIELQARQIREVLLSNTITAIVNDELEAAEQVTGPATDELPG